MTPFQTLVELAYRTQQTPSGQGQTLNHLPMEDARLA